MIITQNRTKTALTLIAMAMAIVLTATPADAAETELVSALTALKDHIEGTTPLNASQIEGHKLTIDSNKYIFGNNGTIIAASFDLVAAYDNTPGYGPLWIARGQFDRRTVADDIHWTIYNVMQYIMDDTYTGANISSHESLIDGFKFESSSGFPGAVDPPADPDETHTATINGSFPKTYGHDTMHWMWPARKPTGTYLAPGTIATITVPPSLAGKGYQVRVGAHSWDMSNRPWVRRLDRSSLVYSIDSTQVKIASPLGGGIYIEVPYLADAGIVDVQIKNAVRSPYFSAKSFHSTSLSEWQNTERNHQAPWADFQSDKFMMQVPRTWIYNLDDPVTLMEDWDAAMDATNDLMGFPHIRGKETMYPQVDVIFHSSAYAPGYPSTNINYTPGHDYGGYHSHHLVRGPQYASYYEFHEQGHAYLFVKFPGEIESNVNLLHVPVWHRKFGYSLDVAFRNSMDTGNLEYRTLDTAAVCWMMCQNFKNNAIMEQLEKQYQLKGHAKFVEIARLFGWEALGNFWYSINVDYENGIYWSRHGSNIDDLILRWSESVGVDITPLFHFWGVHPINANNLKAAIAAENIPASAEIYDTLVKYKSLVPDDKNAYQDFAYNWWEREPRSTGYMTEQDHALLWDTYDQAYAAIIKTNVQNIIDLYFPGGRPFVDAAPAGNPNPEDETTDICPKVVLSWTQGEYADKHDVYFGTNEADVTDATTFIPLGVLKSQGQTENYYPTAGTLDLDFGQTYYWRIDEVNAAPDYTIFKGDIWQFTTEAYGYPITSDKITATASSSDTGSDPNNTIDLDGDLHSFNVLDDVWLSGEVTDPNKAWIQYEFDKVYKLHEMWVWNYNIKSGPNNSKLGFMDVTIEYSTDGGSWTTLPGSHQFAQAPEAADYAHNTTVGFSVAAKYIRITADTAWGKTDFYGLSEVRFFAAEAAATEPSPDGENNVAPDVTLSWKPGRGVAEHDVYISENFDDVNDRRISQVIIPDDGSCRASYAPLSLDLGKTYYWRVDEVNMAEAYTTWESDVWSFTTADHLIVDDIESYGDANTPGEPGGRIWYTWMQGYWFDNPYYYPGNGTGSAVGDWPPPVSEPNIVHGGRWSMPYSYDNDGDLYGIPVDYYSEASANTLDLPIGSKDWSKAKALSLYFYGQSGNNANEQMYVALDDGTESVAVVEYDGDMNDIKIEEWHEWNIALQDFNDLGVNLADVNNIYIGFGIRGNTTTPGGSGKVYFDDITLYPTRCLLSLRSPDFARVDYVEDCVVDYKELKVMAEKWLGAVPIMVPITIDNPGFEDPVLADGEYEYSMDDEGWGYFDNGGDIGPWNPGLPGTSEPGYGGNAPEGQNFGWANPLEGSIGEPGGFAQVLTDPDATLQADTTYTLIVEVGNPPGYPWHGYKVQLLAGGTPHTPGTGGDYTGPVTGGTLLAEDSNSLTIAEDTFETSTVTYTYNPAHSGLLGEPLQIRLLTLGNVLAGEYTEADFDDVTLFRSVDLYEDMEINFKDFAVLADMWLDEQLCP